MKTNTFILIIVSMLASCSTSSDYEEKFKHATKKALISELIFEEDSAIFVGNTHQMCVIDSFVFLLDKYENKNFTLINVNNGDAARICPMGQGPGEIINPSAYVSISTNNTRQCLFVYDVSYSKMFIYRLDSVLENNNTTAFHSLPVSPGDIETGGFSTNIQLINDSIWIGTGLFYNGVFSFYKNAIRNREMVDFYIEDLPIAPIQRATRDANIFRLSKNKTHVVRSTQCAGLIELYQIQGDTLLNKFSNKYFKEDLKVIDFNTTVISNISKYGYIDVCISSDKVYGLYSGKLIEEKHSYQSNQIHVYDFNGVLMEILILDVPVCAMDINDTNNVIYAIAAERERRVLSFKLF